MLSSTAKFTFMALNSTTTPTATPTSRRRQHAAPDGAQYYLLVGAPYYAILFVLFMFLQPPYINAVCLAWPLASPHVAPCISILAMVGRIMNMATIQTQTSSVGGPSGPLVLAEPNRLDMSCALLRHGLTCQSPEPRTLPRSSSIEPRTLPGCCSRILPRNSRLETKTLPRNGSNLQCCSRDRKVAQDHRRMPVTKKARREEQSEGASFLNWIEGCPLYCRKVNKKVFSTKTSTCRDGTLKNHPN